MTDEPTEIPVALEEAQERVRTATEAFDDVSKLLPPGLAPFTLPPSSLETTAAVDGVIGLLITKGIITEEEFVLAKWNRQAELIDACTEMAKEAKGQVSRMILTQQAAQHL